jgi:hypothetical protein
MGLPDYSYLTVDCGRRPLRRDIASIYNRGYRLEFKASLGEKAE